MDIRTSMIAIVRSEAWDINQRLTELDLTKDILLDIVRACVAGRNGCTENDPSNAPGYETWRYGIRRAREILRSQGWEKDESGNYPAVVNHKRRFRLVVMNTDGGTGLPISVPQNRCKKGKNSERAAHANQHSLFGSDEMPVPSPKEAVPKLKGYTTWHLCVFIEGDTVRADFCLLSKFKSGFFTGFYEKIIIVGNDEWKSLQVFNAPEDDDGPEFDVEVKRK